MDFGHFERRHPSWYSLRTSLSLPLFCVASAAIALCLTYRSAPRQIEYGAAAPITRSSAHDWAGSEAFFPGYMVTAYERAKLRRATHIGILQDGVVTDPSPEVMAALRKQFDSMPQPASELVESAGKRGKYRLVTLERLRWETGYRAIADGTLYDGNGGVFGMRFVKPYYDGPSGLVSSESYSQVVTVITQDRITIRSKTGEPVTLPL